MAVEVGMAGLSCQNCNEELKKSRGCNSKPFPPFLFDGEELDRCPIRLIWPSTMWYIEMQSYFEDKFLPFPGSIAQQPAIILDAFSIIGKKKNEMRVKLSKKDMK